MKRRSRPWRLGLAAALVMVGAGAIGCRGRGVEPTLPALATFTPTATSTPTPAATATPAPGSFEIILTEAELNQSLSRAVQDASAPLQDVAVDLQPGLFIVTGRAVLGFFPVDLRLAATVVVQDGKAQAQIQEVKVNGRVAGGAVRQQVDRLLAPYLSQITDLGEGATVQTVEIGEGQVRIVGQK
jgi:hypothetical protein